MPTILVTTSSFDLNNFPEYENLIASGFEVKFNPFGKKMTEAQILDLVDSNVVAMIAGTEPLTEIVLKKASSMKVLVRCGIGMDNVDLIAAKNLKISVFNTPDAPTRAVAELTLGHILGMLRRISESDRELRSGKWKPLMGSLLYGQLVGIIGFGRIGKMVSTLLKAFGAEILVHDAFTVNVSEDVKLVSMEQLLTESDIITLHLPYSSENHHIIDESALAKMKSSSFLVNVSRGGLIDESALYDAIKNKVIAGAALDCFEAEPYSGRLIELENVLLSAHMGSYAKQSRIKQELDSVEVLIRELKNLHII